MDGFLRQQDARGLRGNDFADDQIGIAKGIPETSRELNRTWIERGNRAALTMHPTGGHCGIHDWEEVFECLDDGTGRLLG